MSCCHNYRATTWGGQSAFSPEMAGITFSYAVLKEAGGNAANLEPKCGQDQNARRTALPGRWSVVALTVFLAACVGLPENIKPVDNFKLEKYLGKWYEIARLDHSFERGMTRVTADYSLREDGGVRVINRGFLVRENKWKETQGKAYFVAGTGQGHLKVSFFGPFYGAYVVFELDQENYQYSVVSGPDRSYLWILARDPKMAKETKDRLVAKAAALGFDTARLIFVEQD